MKNEQAQSWNEEMQVRVHGAMPADDYNFKKDVTPDYAGNAAKARELVEKINASGKYRVNVNRLKSDGAEWSVEVRSADDAERLSYVKGDAEAPLICQAIVTADVKL